MQVGDKQPQSFAVNDNVMVRNLRPNATDKWRNGTVTKVLGSLNYEVTIDGHSHQAHIDHLLPGVSTLDVESPTPNNEQADQKHDEHDATTTDNTIVPLEVENDPLHES